MRLIIYINIITSFLLCQEHLEILIQDVLNGSKDSASIYLPMIEKQYPHNPNMLFLKGLMEINGKAAMRIFVELYNNHPTSEYGDDAVMKVAEFYYASGLYIQSAEWLKKMPLYYSRSEHIERAIKLFLNSLIVSGHRDTAIFYSKVFKKQFPSMDVDGKINKLLEDHEYSTLVSIEKTKLVPYNTQKLINPPKSSSPIEAEVDKRSSGKYSLQSGAFSLKENAEKQKIYLRNGGFSARIAELYRKTKVLYAVRIGYFNTSQEAEKLSNKIKSNLDLDTIVVTNK